MRREAAFDRPRLRLRLQYPLRLQCPLRHQDHPRRMHHPGRHLASALQHATGRGRIRAHGVSKCVMHAQQDVSALAREQDTIRAQRAVQIWAAQRHHVARRRAGRCMQDCQTEGGGRHGGTIDAHPEPIGRRAIGHDVCDEADDAVPRRRRLYRYAEEAEGCLVNRGN